MTRSQYGKLLIDGQDAFADYGLFVEHGGFKSLVQMPSFKTIDKTDWPEEDGEEYDLAAPVLQAQSVQLHFVILNVRYAEDLFDELSNGAYHTFYFADLKRTYRLRMTSNGTLSQNVVLGKLSLTFNNDFPVVPTAEPYRHGASDVKQFGYELDNIDFSQFGAFVLKGSDDALRKAANVKKALTIDVKSQGGVIYDDDSVRFASKDVQLKLLINAQNIDEFWRRYDALFAVLLQADERTFYFDALGNEYDCFYKSSSVSKFEILHNNHVWCEFSVTLTFTSWRPVGQYMLLATEDYDWVITEDSTESDYTRIRIRPKRGIMLIVTEDGEYLITEDEYKIYSNS